MNKVLIVDDNEQNRGACQIALEDCFELMFAVNGKEGLAKTKEFKPDLILLDIEMPVMNGYEMLKQLKKNHDFPDIPVLMLTANANVESIERCLRMEADDYVTKPFNVRTLRARVDNLAKKGHAEKMRYEDLISGAAIQQQFLTGERQVIDVFKNIDCKVSIYNQASMNISGDFYYPKPLDGNSAGFFFADTCGHGIPAALISMRALSLMDHLDSPPCCPSELLSAFNDTNIRGLLPAGRFIAANYIILDREKNAFRVSNAGMPYYILARGDSIEEIEVNGAPLGLGRTKYDNVEKSWQAGDRLICYSDGITEAMNKGGELYGKNRLLKCIRENARLSIEKLKYRIIDDLNNFAGERPFDDDITLVIFKNIKGKNENN